MYTIMFGVDVFFVISGYLITRIILKELEEVQKKYFENTFATKFVQNTKKPTFYPRILCNLIFFLQESLF